MRSFCFAKTYNSVSAKPKHNIYTLNSSIFTLKLIGGEKVSTEMVRGTDSRPELVDGSVKIDRKIKNDTTIVPVQNVNPMPMMGFGFMPIAA